MTVTQTYMKQPEWTTATAHCWSPVGNLWVCYATYVDDTTLSEINSSNTSAADMQTLLNQLLTWSDENNMHINSTKTKEMILGSASKRDW